MAIITGLMVVGLIIVGTHAISEWFVGRTETYHVDLSQQDQARMLEAKARELDRRLAMLTRSPYDDRPVSTTGREVGPVDFSRPYVWSVTFSKWVNSDCRGCNVHVPDMSPETTRLIERLDRELTPENIRGTLSS
jgi:hypothetical protein